MHSTVGRLPERKTHQSWPPILHETTVDNTITETENKWTKGQTDRQTDIGERILWKTPCLVATSLITQLLIF